MKLRSHWHCVYHLVLVTKYRKQCLSEKLMIRLEEICKNLCQKWDSKILEFSGDKDHIHILLSLHPNIMPKRLVNSLKTVTSRLIRKEFKEHLDKFFGKSKLWTSAYCLVSVSGASLDILKNINSSSPKFLFHKIIAGEFLHQLLKIIFLITYNKRISYGKLSYLLTF